ncbi:MAG: hypothetical protein JJ953_01545 [Gracilimonas sp.]|uniref:hypothetical protein n=1 Tax=Gracilimonas sp. TaxID=1974203 RepID=UPI001B294221|nr:hypothetical protein [Gracilimonas sp.]MBO6584767.1 hypothetical protein [Gracilimonas sp.]MBO6615962.1 hypothetical protein [Gracilimonas sp.]
MNKFPLVDMLAVFTRYGGIEPPYWRKLYQRDVAHVRSCHSKVQGGIRKSFYTVETKSGDILDLVFDEEELLWSLIPQPGYEGKTIDRMLVYVQRHKHLPSRAHRIVPYRFELLPEELAKKHYDGTERPLIQRMQPYRFQSGKINSAQVIGIPTRHTENVMITKELNYVVETDEHRFFHLVYILDQLDWRMMQEVDEEFFFVK